MRSIARRTAVGAALLLVMPVAVWLSGWRWQPGEQSWLLKAAFWVTETVTQPWGDAPRDKCTLSCAINGIHAAFHYLKKNYISGCVMTVPTG